MSSCTIRVSLPSLAAPYPVLGAKGNIRFVLAPRFIYPLPRKKICGGVANITRPSRESNPAVSRCVVLFRVRSSRAAEREAREASCMHRFLSTASGSHRLGALTGIRVIDITRYANDSLNASLTTKCVGVGRGVGASLLVYKRQFL